MTNTSFFLSDFLYDIARGPLVWISFLIFIGGNIYQIFNLFSLTKLKKRTFVNPAPSPEKKVAKFAFKELPKYIEKLKQTILSVNPITISVSIIFHLCLIISPIFLLAHNMMFNDAIGISLFSFSESITNIFTVIFLICALFFLFRRILLPSVRAISSYSDYIIWGISVAPFLTGFLAYYQVFDYKTLIILHMLTGELMLISIPFTKLFHMVFFFFGRFVLINEHTLGQGNRTW